MKIKNSITSPIYIVTVVPESERSSGWIGITLSPGKKTAGTFNYWDRDLERDLDRLKESGTTVLVPFLEEEEMILLNNQALLQSAAERFEVIHYPFPDGGVPESIGSAARLIEEITGRYLKGEKIVMHCNGGLGRAGTMAACVRIALGLDPSPDEAIESVRKLRDRRAIETMEQEQFIADFFVEWLQSGRGDG